MKPLRVDEVTAMLPDGDELRPLFDLLLATSTPDPSRTWAASGELGTVGERLVDTGALDGAAEGLAERVRDHLASIFRKVTEAIHALGEDDRDRAARHLVRAGELEEAAGRLDRAEGYALAAHRLAEGLPDRTTSSLALRRAARAARTRGDLGVAFRRYDEAYELARHSFDSRGSAEAAIGAGNVLEEQGRWIEAEGWYRDALNELDSVDSGDDPAAERWHACLNIHITLRSRGRIDESLSWLKEAETVARELGDETAPVYLENARGQLAMARGDFEGAEHRLQRALEAADDPLARVTVRLNLAECLLAREQVLASAEEAREAEREALASAVVTKLPEVYRLLGRIAAAQGHREAFVFFERAIRLVRERELPLFEEALTLQAYAAFEAGRGEGEVARRLEEQAREIYDDLGIEHTRNRWADLFRADRGRGDAPEEGSTE